MPNTRWFILNKKVSLTIILLLAVLISISYIGVRKWQESRINPEELLYNSLENTVNADSFRYRIQTELGRENAASTVMGKRTPGSVHIQGTLQDTEFELVRIDDKTYFKESATGKWFTLTGNKTVESELFVELNPLENFNFKDIPEIHYRGIKATGEDGEKLALLELRPNINNQFLQTRFYDFYYQVWVDPRNKLIRRAAIEAKGVQGEKDLMKIVIELWDYNEQIKISPPEPEELTLPD